MAFVALKMLTGDRAKYFALVFTIAFASFLLVQQVSIFVGILERTASQIIDVAEPDLWVMDPATRYFDEVQALKSNDLYRVRGVPGTQWLTQDRSALASGSGLSISAWLGATQAACGLCASLLPRRRLARAASWFSAGAMASPPGTGSSSGHSGVKPFCASTSKLAIFILAFLVALEMATYSI